jgi:hypothetical protein
VGPLFALAAVAIAAYGEPAPDVPEWAALTGALAFFLAGLTLTAQAFGLPRLALAIAPLIVVALGTMFTWVGFAGGTALQQQHRLPRSGCMASPTASSCSRSPPC